VTGRRGAVVAVSGVAGSEALGERRAVLSFIGIGLGCSGVGCDWGCGLVVRGKGNFAREGAFCE
jgi:hypothetical protein